MSRGAFGLMAFAAGIGLGALVMFGVGRDGRPEPGGTRADAAPRPAEISASRRNAIVTAAQRVAPAVVTVSVLQTRVVRTDPFGRPFRDEFFDRFFPPTGYREQVPGLGSGFVIDRRGVILTNEHVVRDAEQITVSLADGRQLPARVLGSTAVYDLAVLKVEADDLPAAPLGDSDGLVVGEWAIAIGNPFGFLLNDPQPTVTAGVISATRRDIKSEATETGLFKDMIQTDAAINPGNSGGPLVNGDGEVIGINTFIFTSGGGSVGMGFATPINLAKRLADETLRHGRIRTPWPGMLVQEITPTIARRLGLSEAGGLIVTRVEPDGPAAQAGVKAGDLLRQVNGRPVRDLEDAQSGIYGAQVGDPVKLGLERDGRALEVTFKLAEAPRARR
jgi:serine protease Do